MPRPTTPPEQGPIRVALPRPTAAPKPKDQPAAKRPPADQPRRWQ